MYGICTVKANSVCDWGISLRSLSWSAQPDVRRGIQQISEQLDVARSKTVDNNTTGVPNHVTRAGSYQGKQNVLGALTRRIDVGPEAETQP